MTTKFAPGPSPAAMRAAKDILCPQLVKNEDKPLLMAIRLEVAAHIIDREFGPVVEALRRIERLLDYPNAQAMQNAAPLSPEECRRLIDASLAMQDPRATALSVARQALSALEAK